MTSPMSTKSCRKLRSSLVPSQKILEILRIVAVLSAFLLAQQQQAQQQQDRDEDRQHGQIRAEIMRSRGPW